MPRGYKSGKTKFVIITGSVMSGIGKGITTSCIAKLLEDRGLKVEPMKLEAYLNVDAGTLNPYRHGEVFVLDDGSETDMDLGSYERFLDKQLSGDHFVTSGRIYQKIIEKERRGEYLGRDVQFIPHVTGEAKKILRDIAVKTKADVVLVEIGGTVGDYENLFAMEAIRELIYEEGKQNVCFVNVTYIMEPPSVGEFKTKAAQMGIKRVMELGIMPDLIICRSEKPITEKVKEKISLFVNVPVERVIGAHNVDNIYSLPLFLRKQGVDSAILSSLCLDKKFKLNGNKKLIAWTDKCVVKNPRKHITIGIAGKYLGLNDAYISILKALEHCAGELKVKINVKWIDTTDIEEGKKSVELEMSKVDGLIVPGGFGSRGIEGKIACVKYARESNIPFLGLCLGFQMAAIEFARNVCGLKNANSTEINPKTPHPVICILPEQQKLFGLGGTLRLGGHNVLVSKNSLAFKLYKKSLVRERFRHRFEMNPKYIKTVEKKGLKFSGRAPKETIMQILELPSHKFFIASQFHPEFTSRPTKPNPLFLGFTKACI
ncbi:MAG: CTP synthase (glutamine hydrolyzing) [Candidatus Diapherotrites archaeon]